MIKRTYKMLLPSLFLTLGLCFLPLISVANGQEPFLAMETMSYGQLAKTTLEKSMETFYGELAKFNDQTLPKDSKKLRKSLYYVKQLLDIFIYAYPAGQKDDLLKEFRKNLDTGYAVIGQFKDIADSSVGNNGQEDEDEIKDLRKKCLEWKKDHLTFANKFKMGNYLSNPLEHEIFLRKIEDLPKYYWRQVSFRPNLALTGLQNIRTMAIHLSAKAQEHLNQSYGLNDLTIAANEELFHSVRKEIRAVVKLDESIKEIYPSIFKQEASYLYLVSQVEKFGNLHDSIMAYHRAVKKKNLAKAQELKTKIFEQWANFKNDLQRENAFDQLEQLKQLIGQLL